MSSFINNKINKRIEYMIKHDSTLLFSKIKLCETNQRILKKYQTLHTLNLVNALTIHNIALDGSDTLLFV